MSSDEGGHEQNKRCAADQRTTPIEPDAWLIAFKAFVEEYKRNNAEAERQSRAKTRWDKTVAVGVCIYTVKLSEFSGLDGSSFRSPMIKQRAQLRPYILAEFSNIGIPRRGEAPDDRIDLQEHWKHAGLRWQSLSNLYHDAREIYSCELSQPAVLMIRQQQVLLSGKNVRIVFHPNWCSLKNKSVPLMQEPRASFLSGDIATLISSARPIGPTLACTGNCTTAR